MQPSPRNFTLGKYNSAVCTMCQYPREPPTAPTFQQETGISHPNFRSFFQLLNSDCSAIFCFLPLTLIFNQLLNVLIPLSLLSSLASSSLCSIIPIQFRLHLLYLALFLELAIVTCKLVTYRLGSKLYSLLGS